MEQWNNNLIFRGSLNGMPTAEQLHREILFLQQIDMKMQSRIVRMRDIHLDESLFRNYLARYKELC